MIKNLAFTKVAPKVATPQDMIALESQLGVKLPSTFHEFCFRWNGGFSGKENQYYLVPSSFAEFYRKYYFGRKMEGVGVVVDNFLGASEEFPQCNLMKHYRRSGGAEWGFIPITGDIMGGMAVLRADSPMEKVYWIDPDTFEMPGGVEWGTTPGNPEARLALMPIAPDLETFYNSLTSDPDKDC